MPKEKKIKTGKSVKGNQQKSQRDNPNGGTEVKKNSDNSVTDSSMEEQNSKDEVDNDTSLDENGQEPNYEAERNSSGGNEREGTPFNMSSSFTEGHSPVNTEGLRKRDNLQVSSSDSERSSGSNEERQNGKNFPVKHESRPEPPNGPSNLIQVVCLLIVLVVLGLSVNLDYTAKQDKTVVEKFLEKIGDMQSQTMQDKKLWRIVKSSMREHIVEDNPTQPSVLMLVSTKESSEMREKLAREIAEAYSIRCQDSDVVMIHGAKYASMDHDSAKKEVDDILLSGFEAKSCAAIVSNFEKLPAATTKVFYQFCENDYAPFKDVAVIFTLEVEPGPWDPDKTFLVPGMTPEPNMWDPIVDAYLYHSLESRDDSGTMKRDMIGGLLTRITPGVVWVK